MRAIAATLAVCLALCCASAAQETERPGTEAAPRPPADPNASGPGLYAVIDTSMGQIVVRLLEDKAPKTVASFVGLATGTKTSAEVDGKKMVHRHFYDGLIFHRVIRGFMIQTGDLTGRGDGNCGVTPIPDEIDPTLKFDAPGRLAMANLGRPNTAACQIFITVGAAQHLNGTFTIFGLVSSGQDVADKIASVQTLNNARPAVPVTLNKVTIERRDH
jgi:peptidyl-prolyl cis-trans isomerase A (cyclophilin A)